MLGQWMTLEANVPIKVAISRGRYKDTQEEFSGSPFCPSLEGIITHYMTFNTEEGSNHQQSFALGVRVVQSVAGPMAG